MRVKVAASACLALLLLSAAAARSAELAMAEVVRAALSGNADVLVQAEEVEVARARHEQARGAFDLLFSAGPGYQRALTPSAVAGTRGDALQTELLTTSYQAALDKQLRNGMRIGATLDARSVAGHMPGSADLPAQNATTLGVTLSAPLLRNGDAGVTTAIIEGARLNVLVSRYQLRIRAAQLVYDVIAAYWECRARVGLRQIAVGTESRSADLLASTRKLVEAGETPRADLVLLEATLADRRAERLAATLALAESKRVLGRLLGLDADAVARLPDPHADFPPPPDVLAGLADAGGRLAAAALDARPELRALALQGDAAAVQLRAADHRRGPRLDLIVGANYTKASEGGSHYGFIAEPGRVQSSPSVSAKLAFQFPLGNHGATGALRESAAAAAEITLRWRDMGAAVAVAIDGALASLVESAAQLALAQQGLLLYETAVAQEVYKQKNGAATVIDVIGTEERFNNAQVKVLQLQLAYVKALARLKFETATLLPMPPLVEAAPDTFAVDAERLLDLAPLAAPSIIKRNASE